MPVPALPHPRAPRVARLLGGMLLLGILATSCATTTPGQATPATGAAAPPSGTAADPVMPLDSSASGPSSPPPVTATTERSSPADSPATPTPPAEWSVVPPAALQTWQELPTNGVSRVWHSGSCLLVVSVPSDLPDITDEGVARAHARWAVSTWIELVDPTIAESGDHTSRGTAPLRVSDPTRTSPPAVHLQLSGFRKDFPTVGVTDQTYAFVTGGGGQGLAVSAVCPQGEFAGRYDTEIAPLVADLGVDTGL